VEIFSGGGQTLPEEGERVERCSPFPAAPFLLARHTFLASDIPTPNQNRKQHFLHSPLGSLDGAPIAEKLDKHTSLTSFSTDDITNI
jgi:hypothetical protein